MAIRYYGELIVWQKAMDLAVQVYELTKILPKEEMYTLTSQMRRCAVSIPSNIAEGHQRNSPKEYARYLTIALGSQAELSTQLILCTRLGYLTDVSEQQNLLAEVGKMLNTIIKKLTPNP